tara:strand:- start:4398 stop:4661 length:264 start_codon:yes stop_codon:yes gene_type:complete
MAFKMKNTAYYKKKFTESEMASPYSKSSFTDNFTSASKQLNAALKSGKMSKAEYDAAMASLEKSSFNPPSEKKFTTHLPEDKYREDD